jgi:hypothetical protein
VSNSESLSWRGVHHAITAHHRSSWAAGPRLCSTDSTPHSRRPSRDCGAGQAFRAHREGVLEASRRTVRSRQWCRLATLGLVMVRRFPHTVAQAVQPASGTSGPSLRSWAKMESTPHRAPTPPSPTTPPSPIEPCECTRPQLSLHHRAAATAVSRERGRVRVRRPMRLAPSVAATQYSSQSAYSLVSEFFLRGVLGAASGDRRPSIGGVPGAVLPSDRRPSSGVPRG